MQLTVTTISNINCTGVKLKSEQPTVLLAFNSKQLMATTISNIEIKTAILRMFQARQLSHEHSVFVVYFIWPLESNIAVSYFATSLD